MATSAPKLGEPDERCVQCAAPLAEDQRYCLNCGQRRAQARLPFLEVLAERRAEGLPPRDASAIASTESGARSVTPLAAVTAVSAVVVALAAGVVIGHQGDQAKPAKPQVISVGGGGPAAAATPVAQKLVDDWPKGKNGYTVQLQALPKDSTQPSAVAAAKTAAQGKGAPAVGALDTDNYASLEGGSYVVYSGVFDQRKQAQAALAKLKKSFPTAKVVQVSSSGGSQKGDPNALNGKTKSATVDKSQLKQLHNLSPSEYQKKAAKLPDETKLPGKPPPTDSKAPGGGSGAGASG